MIMNSASDNEIRARNVALGLRIKNLNLMAALVSGTTLAVVSARVSQPSPVSFCFGLLAGLVYANGFEYCLHKYLLHRSSGIYCRQHMMHHTTLRAPEEAYYVNFSRNPWGVVALFFANALPFFALEWMLRNGWAPGAFVSFSAYYMAFEEIHWRSHMGGWIPGWLKPAARHHLRHHGDDTSRFNVFLPLFDGLISLCGSARSHAKPEKSADSTFQRKRFATRRSFPLVNEKQK